MSKNKDVNKQNVKASQKNTDKKKKISIFIGIGLFIILLLSLLLIFGKKSDNGIMNEFYKNYESSKNIVFLYYDSKEETDGAFELDYLIQLSKDYNLDYLSLDKSLLNAKEEKKIEKLLGIDGDNPTTVVVNNKKIMAVQSGFIESNKLVAFLIKAKVLKDDAVYKPTDNLTFIDYNQYLKYLDDEKQHLVIVGQAGCEYCIAVKPILNNISKAYKLTISYLDVTDFKRDDYNSFFDDLPKLGYDDERLTSSNLFNMPTLLVIDKGQITSYLQSAKSLEEYVSYFKELNIIK